MDGDWEDEVARAYATFGVDPLDSEFGFHFPRLSTSFLRTKALRQLRDRFGRWRQERGSLDLEEPQEVARLKPFSVDDATAAIGKRIDEYAQSMGGTTRKGGAQGSPRYYLEGQGKAPGIVMTHMKPEGDVVVDEIDMDYAMLSNLGAEDEDIYYDPMAVLDAIEKGAQEGGARSIAVGDGGKPKGLSVADMARLGYDFDWEKQTPGVSFIPTLSGSIRGIWKSVGADADAAESILSEYRWRSGSDDPQDRPSLLEVTERLEALMPDTVQPAVRRMLLNNAIGGAGLRKMLDDTDGRSLNTRASRGGTVVSQEQFEAAKRSLMGDPSERLPRKEGHAADKEAMVAALLGSWIDGSKAFVLDPSMDLPFRRTGAVGVNAGNIMPVGGDEYLDEVSLAKRLVTENLSDATADRFSVGQLVDLFAAGQEDADIWNLSKSTGSPGMLKMGDLLGNDYLTHVLQKEDGSIMAGDSRNLEDVPSEGWAEKSSPEGQTMIRDALMSRLIKEWAKSSNGGELALAVQEAAEDLLPEEARPTPWRMTPQQRAQVDAYLEHREVLDAVLEEQYGLTQKFLASLTDLDEVPLYRGVLAPPERAAEYVPGYGTGVEAVGDDGSGIEGMTVTEAVQRPLSSWSTDVEQAILFSRGITIKDAPLYNWVQILIGAGVPIQEILSTTLTGYGAFNEKEMVALSSLRRAAAVPLNAGVRSASGSDAAMHRAFARAFKEFLKGL